MFIYTQGNNWCIAWFFSWKFYIFTKLHIILIQVWAGATVISTNEEGIEAKLDSGGTLLVTKPEDYCISGPADEEAPDDLTAFTHLNDAVILQSLHDRFKKDIIYTFTGSILIAVNPFKTLPNVFNDETLLDFMKENRSYSACPHVYSTAMSAYQGLCARDKSQVLPLVILSTLFPYILVDFYLYLVQF